MYGSYSMVNISDVFQHKWLRLERNANTLLPDYK